MRQSGVAVTAINRRRFLLWSAAAASTLLGPLPVAAASAKRELSFASLHTGEKLTAAYWHDGAYDREALAAIDRVLRDHRTGESTAIDRRLLDLLHALRAKLDTREPFEVISGYRSPATNAMLISTGHGVAKKSLHMQGMAIDLRVPGRRLASVRKAAIALRRGGVGYYPASDFVHVDVGRVRTW
jgi:uncharacterized protein YcbK (DUF882 family)